MNKAAVEQAINHISDLCNSKAQACISGKELAYHAEVCVRMADSYEQEAQSFGRGVPKALRAELIDSIAMLRERATEFASEEAQARKDDYTTMLRNKQRNG